MERMNSFELTKKTVTVIEAKKGEDTIIYDMRKLVYFTDFFSNINL